ncbi:hypothetical protein QW131_30035 [Roseibium salinum]|nr:hypothetical protein [Roseibium salinum]
MAEQALRELEALACLAMTRCGHAYPAERLHELWRIALLHQFHDILPGTSIGAVFDDSDRDYERFFKGVAELKQELAAAIAGGNGRLLFNILGRPRRGLVSLEGSDAKKTFSIVARQFRRRPFAAPTGRSNRPHP